MERVMSLYIEVVRPWPVQLANLDVEVERYNEIQDIEREWFSNYELADRLMADAPYYVDTGYELIYFLGIVAAFKSALVLIDEDTEKLLARSLSEELQRLRDRLERLPATDSKRKIPNFATFLNRIEYVSDWLNYVGCD